jgi:ATP-dependent Clp protease ATP-binding subunit ClpX
LPTCDPLDRESLKRILTEPKSALIRQYRKLFAMEGIELVLQPEAVDMIADKAFEFKLGARGLRALCESLLTDAMFELPGSVEKGETRQLIIDANYVREKLEGARKAKLKAADPEIH